MKYHSDIEQNVGEGILLLAGNSARSSGQEEAQIVRSDTGMDLGKGLVEAGLRHCTRWHASPRRDSSGATPGLTVVVTFTCSCMICGTFDAYGGRIVSDMRLVGGVFRVSREKKVSSFTSVVNRAPAYRRAFAWSVSASALLSLQ